MAPRVRKMRAKAPREAVQDGDGALVIRNEGNNARFIIAGC